MDESYSLVPWPYLMHASIPLFLVCDYNFPPEYANSTIHSLDSDEVATQSWPVVDLPDGGLPEYAVVLRPAARTDLGRSGLEG